MQAIDAVWILSAVPPFSTEFQNWLIWSWRAPDVGKSDQQTDQTSSDKQMPTSLQHLPLLPAARSSDQQEPIIKDLEPQCYLRPFGGVV